MKKHPTTCFTVLLLCGLFITPAQPAGIKGEKTVFIPTYGIIGENSIRAEIHLWIFQPEENSALRNVITAAVKNLLPDEDEPRNPEIFKRRIRQFMVDNKRNITPRVIIDWKTYILNATKADGHSVTALTLPLKPEHRSRKTLPVLVKADAGDTRTFGGALTLEKPDGLSVISDIDDTIKISDVLDKKALIRNTFVLPYRAVDKMAEFYTLLENNNATFHYVSGSPWQMYEELSAFMDKAGFPRGSFHLKKFRIKDRSSVDFITADQKDYKLSVLSKIIEDLPGKRFILIGDSGETDAETYLAIYRKYPDSVRAVFIRDAGNLGTEHHRFNTIKEKFSPIIFSFFNDGGDLLKLHSQVLNGTPAGLNKKQQ